MKRLKNWYNSLPVIQQLVISFMLQWVYWLGGWRIIDHLFKSPKPVTTGELVFKTTWMAFFMTVLFGWKRIKQLRKRKDGQQ